MSKKFGQKERLVQEKFGSKEIFTQKIGSKLLGQKRIINSWDIADLYKRRLDVFCLDNGRCDGWHLFKIVQGKYLNPTCEGGGLI